MKCQFTLTVSEGKRLIAKAIASLPEVRKALSDGLILLKGGTTVSAISEELCGQPLRISGRVTPRGTVSSGAAEPEGPHSILLRRGAAEKADGRLAEIAREMGRDDVCVCGANLIDPWGGAAMMAGKDLCGEPGSVIPALESEGVRCYVAAGLEKLSPVPLREACGNAGRKASVWAMGMAVGLVPVPGRVVTELDALSLLGWPRRWLVGRGGISGAEGASTFVVEEGSEETIRALLRLLRNIKGAVTSGILSSMEECLRCGPGRPWHLGCVYGRNTQFGRDSDEKSDWNGDHRTVTEN